MYGIIVEVIKIFMALFGAVGVAEIGDAENGAARKEEVVAVILKEVTDKGGIEITNKWVLKALPSVLPFMVDQVVRMANKSGFLTKSGE